MLGLEEAGDKQEHGSMLETSWRQMYLASSSACEVKWFFVHEMAAALRNLNSILILVSKPHLNKKDKK